MFEARLRDRICSAKVIGTYKLQCHDLRFHKRSDKDKSGKCDAYETGNVADFILGRLFYIEESEECKLDKYEGLGTGYEKKSITVVMTSATLMMLLLTMRIADTLKLHCALYMV